MTRCFLGFEFQPESLAYLRERVEPFFEKLKGELGWDLRLIRPENWHVTLLFFQGLEASEREEVWGEVEKAARGGVWKELAFDWKGLAVWPSPRRPSLICLEAGLYPATPGWPLPVSREPFSKGEVGHYLSYRPHATLMRLKGRSHPVIREWKGLEGSLPEIDPGEIRFDRVSFFLSTLSREQPVYPRESSSPLS